MGLEFDRNREEFFEKCVESGSFPRNDALKLIVLERIMANEFRNGEVYTKAAVNEKVAAYFEDVELVRREFVNFRYLQYDNRANEYTAMKKSLSEGDVREISRLERHARDIGALD